MLAEESTRVDELTRDRKTLICSHYQLCQTRSLFRYVRSISISRSSVIISNVLSQFSSVLRQLVSSSLLLLLAGNVKRNVFSGCDPKLKLNNIHEQESINGAAVKNEWPIIRMPRHSGPHAAAFTNNAEISRFSSYFFLRIVIRHRVTYINMTSYSFAFYLPSSEQKGIRTAVLY